jgi:hypothetical protein
MLHHKAIFLEGAQGLLYYGEWILLARQAASLGVQSLHFGNERIALPKRLALKKFFREVPRHVRRQRHLRKAVVHTFHLTFPINGSRPQDYPHRWASSRVHCIGWFGAGLLGCLRNILDELPNSRVLRCEKRKHSDPEPLLTISRQMMGIKSIDFAKSEVADE